MSKIKPNHLKRIETLINTQPILANLFRRYYINYLSLYYPFDNYILQLFVLFVNRFYKKFYTKCCSVFIICYIYKLLYKCSGNICSVYIMRRAERGRARPQISLHNTFTNFYLPNRRLVYIITFPKQMFGERSNLTATRGSAAALEPQAVPAANFFKKLLKNY